MNSDRRLVEVSQVFLLGTGYIFVGAYAAITLQVEPTQWLFFVLHLLSGIILLEITMAMISELSLLRAPSLVLMVMSSLYYIASSTKYFTGLEVYPQFSITNQDRFYGSVGVFAVLLLCLALIARLSRRLGRIVDGEYLNQIVDKLPGILLLFLIADATVKLSLINMGYGPSYFPGQYTSFKVMPYWGLALLTTASITSDVVQILSAAIIVAPKKNSRVSSIVLPTVGIGLQLLWAIFMRSRGLLLSPVMSVGICLSLLRKPRMARMFLRWLIFFVFVVGTVGSTAVLGLLGRSHLEGPSALYASVAEMGYRLDLSDFAVAYMRHRTRATVHFGIVAEAIMNAVPRLLVPTKNLGGQYEKLFADMGWPVVDYTDTLFSSGALVADWLGFLLWPLGFIFCVEIGYRLAFSLMKRLSNDVFFAAGYLYLLVNLLRIELEWSLLFLYIRASLIGLIMIFMLSGPARIRGKSVAHHRTGVEVAYR